MAATPPAERIQPTARSSVVHSPGTCPGFPDTRKRLKTSRRSSAAPAGPGSGRSGCGRSDCRPPRRGRPRRPRQSRPSPAGARSPAPASRGSPGARQAFQHVRAHGVYGEADDMHRAPAPGDRDLDAGDQPNAMLGRRGRGLGDTGDGVVVGEREGRDPSRRGAGDQFHRRQGAVGRGGVGMQVWSWIHYDSVTDGRVRLVASTTRGVRLLSCAAVMQGYADRPRRQRQDRHCTGQT
jgi:hypothetical protein